MGLQSILSADTASTIAVAEKMLALGTNNGTVHILDFQGNEIQQFPVHSGKVNEVSFDTRGEFVGSCSDDGSVVITSLFTDESVKFDYLQPMKTLALDPNYSQNASKRFVCGGLAGKLLLNRKNWLGYLKETVHEDEGSIHVVRWRTSLIAWANDVGVKVYDIATSQVIYITESLSGSPRAELLLPHIVWQDDTVLVVGLGKSVTIAAVRGSSVSSAKYVDIMASFQTSYYVCGIAPFGDSLMILSYVPVEQNREKDVGTAQRPLLCVVSWKNVELTTYVLPVHGYEHYRAKDHALGSSYAGGEPLYYVVCPKDVVVVSPRDDEVHIACLVQHGFDEKALAVVEAREGPTELLNEEGAIYLDHLIVERKYAEAASLCPQLLHGSASAWERWVFQFAQLRQIPFLVPYMPIKNPQLSDTTYEVALVALANNKSSHKLLFSTVKKWPTALYSVMPVISAIEPKLNTSSMTGSLKEALAELYIIDDQHEKALALYADLMKPEIFDFIERHNLHDVVLGKVVKLMLLDEKKALHLLVQNREFIPPDEVVGELLATESNCDKRHLLHLYLHALYEVDPEGGREFHDLLVELYAEYEPKMLLPFLRSSRHYQLDKAYEICTKQDRIKEQAFILGRMGNAKEDISVIINKLEDMEEAIEFVTMQHDDELWEELIEQCFRKPEMIGTLSDHTVGNLDPLYIVKKVPNGLEIPQLRDRLVKVITDYRTETSLRHGCNTILQSELFDLLAKYYKEARRAVYLDTEVDDGESSTKRIQVKMRTRSGGRCCLCLDPFSVQNVSVVVFFCCHAYHLSCLMDASDSLNMENNVIDDDDDDDNNDGTRKRCVLCTAASRSNVRRYQPDFL